MSKTPEELAVEYAPTFEDIMKQYTEQWDGCPYILGSTKGITAVTLAYGDGYGFGFIAGYQAAKDEDSCEHILDMEKMVDVNSSNNSNGWISVKNRLPEDGTGWLTVYGSIPNLRFFVGPGYYDFAKKEWLSRFLNYRARKDTTGLVTDQIEYLAFEQVTHWQELPQPPKEEK
jgi:hypothetical protein